MLEPGTQPVSLFEIVVHVSEVLIAAPVAWQVLRAANRILDVLKDFPPHRHINGTILYPKGFSPPETGSIERTK